MNELSLDEIGDIEWGAACVGLPWDVRVAAVRAVERALRAQAEPKAGEAVAWLHYAPKKPSLKRVDFSPRPSIEEAGRGWVSIPLSAGPAPAAKAGEARDAASKSPTLAYSLDEERYEDDFWELLRQLDDADSLVEGATYSVGEVVRHKASDFTKGCADSILEGARDAAFDVADEWADSFAYPVSQALRDDLERVVGEWADANLPVTFWTVDKVREAKVTAEDIAEFRRDDADMSRASEAGGEHA